MTREVVNLANKLKQFEGLWSPRVIAELNDYQVKLAKFEGEFVWHQHADTDELFLVLQGSMSIEFRDRTIHLVKGEMVVVAKGVEHKPCAAQECHVLLIEPRGVVNTGQTGGGLRAQNDLWV